MVVSITENSNLSEQDNESAIWHKKHKPLIDMNTWDISASFSYLSTMTCGFQSFLTHYLLWNYNKFLIFSVSHSSYLHVRANCPALENSLKFVLPKHTVLKKFTKEKISSESLQCLCPTKMLTEWLLILTTFQEVFSIPIKLHCFWQYIFTNFYHAILQ